MRYGLVALAITAAIALQQGWCAGLHRGLSEAALSEDARLALEVGCRGREGREAEQCRSRLQRLYLAGSLDPVKTLRAYCDEVRDARWGGGRPPPPKLCVERFGGWQEG